MGRMSDDGVRPTQRRLRDAPPTRNSSCDYAPFILQLCHTPDNHPQDRDHPPPIPEHRLQDHVDLLSHPLSSLLGAMLKHYTR